MAESDSDNDPAVISTSNLATIVEPVIAANETIYRAIIHFTVNKVELKLSSPWKTGSPKESTGTGFYIGKNRIVTNCHVVKHATSIRLERNGKPGTFKGIVIFKSELCDLALVTVENDSFWEDLPHVDFEEHVPNLGDAVIAVGYPLGNKTVTVTRGIVSTICLKDLTLLHMNPRLMCIQIDAAINPGNSGGPVISIESRKAVGVAFSHRNGAQLMSFIISIPVLRMFIEAYEQRDATANISSLNLGLLPDIGVYIDELKNVSLRKKLFGKLYRDDFFYGCLVTSVEKYCPSTDTICVGDVILEVDELPVSENGEVHFRNHEWLPLDWLITKKKFGEILKVKILRPGSGCKDNYKTGIDDAEPLLRSVEEIEVAVPIAKMRHLVPKILGVDLYPYWVIVGGLVFVQVSQPLVVQLGKDGEFLKKMIMGTVKQKEEEEIVVVIDVLAHFINTSYRKYKWNRLVKVNGEQVVNMQHLACMVHRHIKDKATTTDASRTDDTPQQQENDFQDRSGDDADDFIEFDFYTKPSADERRIAVFEVTSMLKAENEILHKHKIPTWCSPELLASH